MSMSAFQLHYGLKSGIAQGPKKCQRTNPLPREGLNTPMNLTLSARCSWLIAGLSEKGVIPSSPQRPKCHVAEGSDCNQPQGHASTRTSKKAIAIEETGKREHPNKERKRPGHCSGVVFGPFRFHAGVHRGSTVGKGKGWFVQKTH